MSLLYSVWWSLWGLLPHSGLHCLSLLPKTGLYMYEKIRISIITPRYLPPSFNNYQLMTDLVASLSPTPPSYF